MKVSLVRSYRSKNGNVTFVYKVTGSAEKLEQYKSIQGEFFREDDNGNPLWFTTRCIGQSGTLLITSNNNIVPDMSKFDQAASLSEQYGGNFGQSLANSAAAELLGHSTPAAVETSTSAPVETPEEEPTEE